MMDKANFIKHCENEINAADNEIRDVDKLREHVIGRPKLLDDIIKYAESKKEIYQTLLNDVKNESQ